MPTEGDPPAAVARLGVSPSGASGVTRARDALRYTTFRTLHRSPMANATPYGYRVSPTETLRVSPLGVRFAHTGVSQ